MQILDAKAKAADEAAREARGMVLKEELRGRRRLLRKLGHTDRDLSVLLPKGQACVLRLSKGLSPWPVIPIFFAAPFDNVLSRSAFYVLQ